MKSLAILSLLFAYNTYAGEVSYVSQRLEQDIINTMQPMDAVEANYALGRWKKVLHGSNKEKVGTINTNGIAEGANKSILELVISKTSLDWFPQEVSTVYAAQLINFPVHTEPSSSLHINSSSNSEIAGASLSGNTLNFRIRTTYNYSYSYERGTYYFGGYVSGTETIHRDNESYSFSVDYSCALQAGNHNRLICKQAMEKAWNRDDGRSKTIEAARDFPPLIAFERVE